MAFAKRDFYDPLDIELSDVSQGFSFPARPFIIRTLRFDGPKYVHELEQMMPLVQASVSHHLSKLLEIGILDVEVHRLKNRYHLNEPRLADVAEQYARWFDEIKERRTVERMRPGAGVGQDVMQ